MVTSHVSEGTKPFAYRTSTRYLNPQLRYYYFRLMKQTTAILSLYFLFNFDIFTTVGNGVWFCIGPPNFMQIRWSPTDLWRHINFTRWRHIYFRFLVWSRFTFKKI